MNHRCKCRRCQPREFAFSSLGEHYTPKEHAHLVDKVLFNGANVTYGVTDLWLPINGTGVMICHTGTEGEPRAPGEPAHVCQSCENGVCEQVLVGRIEIVWSNAS